MFNFQTWESGGIPSCNNWECERGKRTNFWLWKNRIDSREWTTEMILTTKYTLTPSGVKQAVKAFNNFMRALKRFDPKIVFVRGFDINKRGFIHFNVAVNAELPKIKRLKDLWHKQTGCHHVEVKPFHSNVAYYLAKRATELPDIKDGKSPQWEGHKRIFRRVQPSLGLFPEPARKRKDDSSWRALDGDYIELLASLNADKIKLLKSLKINQIKKSLGTYSMTADRAIP